PEESKLARPLVQLPWELALLLPLVLEGDHLRLDPAADCLPELLVLRLEGREQPACAGVLDDRHPREASTRRSDGVRGCCPGFGTQEVPKSGHRHLSGSIPELTTA